MGCTRMGMEARSVCICRSTLCSSAQSPCLGAGTLEKLAKGFCLGKGTLKINFEILNMKAAVKYLLITATVVATLVLFSFFSSKKNEVKQFYHFPYKQAGLTERQAAAHLLSRFTYGATPHQVEEVVSIGLEK